MDRDCSSLLPGVCEVLAATGSSLPDDTSLEKLLDWFTELTKAGGSLLESCPCLLDFISAVARNTAADPGVLAFALKLTGLIAAAEDAFKVLQECSVLDVVFNVQHWKEAGLWEDPCTRSGWIMGLKAMLQHSQALQFLIQGDFIEPLLQLQTDSSLFVASDANQMLAQVLLLCQPDPSGGCNGRNNKGVNDGKSQASITDLEHLALTMQTNEKVADVTAVILEYLKKSLVPKEKAHLHQSLQTLKLLVLVLSRAGSPLREELLNTVSDSLEELVTADLSQLTLPLMDVLGAAYSCSSDERVPDRRVSRLLSLMLSIKKPADQIHAAAAFLRRGHHDGVHTAQCVKMLLRPLDIITGETLLGTNPSEDELRLSVEEQLRRKTSCTSIICVCLTNTPQITLMDPDSLPCPPGSIIAAVLSLLKLCCGDSSSSSSAASGQVYTNIIGSGKVQKCALEALMGLSSSPGANYKLLEVFTLLIQYLEYPDCDPTVVHKSYQALVKWMSVCSDVSSLTKQLRQDLLRAARKRACDMRWEVRDSTVEFLGQLAGLQISQSSPEEASDPPEALLGGCSSTTSLLSEALQDPESYVRASAVSALALTQRAGWKQGTEITQQQTEIVRRLLQILSEDTEGFARRAVVQYFIAWFSSHSSHSSSSSPPSSSSSSSLLLQSVRSVLSRGSADLDWEVKVHTLQLAELLLEQAFSGHWCPVKDADAPPHPYAVTSVQVLALRTLSGACTEDVGSDLASALNSVVEQGVFSALLSGLVDCDRPVGLKACRLLIALRDKVCPPSQTAGEGSVEEMSCVLPAQGWAREIRNTLEAKNLRSLSRVIDPTDCDESVEGKMRLSVCEVLRSLSLDERLDELTQSSDHVHNSPLSLLQDILTASHAHTHPQPGEEVIVDCY